MKSRYIGLLLSTILIAVCLWVNLTHYPIVWTMLDGNNTAASIKSNDSEEGSPQELFGSKEQIVAPESSIAENAIEPLLGDPIPIESPAATAPRYSSRFNTPIPPDPVSENIGEKRMEQTVPKKNNRPIQVIPKDEM